MNRKLVVIFVESEKKKKKVFKLQDKEWNVPDEAQKLKRKKANWRAKGMNNNYGQNDDF